MLSHEGQSVICPYPGYVTAGGTGGGGGGGGGVVVGEECFSSVGSSKLPVTDSFAMGVLKLHRNDLMQ